VAPKEENTRGKRNTSKKNRSQQVCKTPSSSKTSIKAVTRPSDVLSFKSPTKSQIQPMGRLANEGDGCKDDLLTK